MKISKTLQTPEGIVTFSGELSEVEADYIVEIGLNFLLKQGALPFGNIKPVNLSPSSLNQQ